MNALPRKLNKFYFTDTALLKINDIGKLTFDHHFNDSVNLQRNVMDMLTAPTHLMKSVASARMTNSRATAFCRERALQWTDAKTKLNLRMDLFSVLKDG